MFQLHGLLQAMGVSLLITITFGFIIGFLNLVTVEWSIILSFLVSYISIGILGPLWNRQTPYFAAFIGSLTLTVFNFIFSIMVLRIPVLLDPLEINRSIIASISTSLLSAVLFLVILKRNESSKL